MDEIEQALDLARAEVEIAISRLRLGVVGGMSAAIAAAVLMGNRASAPFDLASGPVFFVLATPPPGQDVHVAATGWLP